MNLTMVCKIKRKPIRIITSYCRKKFQTNKTRIYRKFSMIHRKFPINTCLICLEFFPTIRCYYSDWFSFYWKYIYFLTTRLFLNIRPADVNQLKDTKCWLFSRCFYDFTYKLCLICLCKNDHFGVVDHCWPLILRSMLSFMSNL